MWPFTESRAKRKERRDTQNEITELREKLGAVESLLDLGDDPDANLPGDQAQGLFRSIAAATGFKKDSIRDFTDTQRSQLFSLCHKLYALRGTAHNLIEIFVDFIVGDELVPQADRPVEAETIDKKTPEEKAAKFKQMQDMASAGATPPPSSGKPFGEAEDDDDTSQTTPTDEEGATLQKHIDDVWFDPRNNLSDRSENLVRMLLLEGELFLPCDMSGIDGHLEMGYMGPENVHQVQKDKRGRDNFVMLMDPKNPGEHLKYLVLNHIDEKITIDRRDGGGYTIKEEYDDGDEMKTRETPVNGLCFAFFNNRPEGATRGRPELTEVADYIDIHDELVWTQVEREKMLRLFMMVVTANDITDKTSAEKKAKELGLDTPPRHPKVIFKNEKTTIDMLSPETGSRPMQQLEQIIRFLVYGSKGVPEHWSGSGGGSNFATARAQDLVPLRRLRRKQRFMIQMFRTIVDISLMLRRVHDKSIPEDPDYDLTYLEVGGRDRQRGATILKDLVVAMSTARTDQAITREAYNQVIMQAIDEAGFDVKPENQGLPPEEDDFVTNMRNRLGNPLDPLRQKGSRGDDEGDPDTKELKDEKARGAA